MRKKKLADWLFCTFGAVMIVGSILVSAQLGINQRSKQTQEFEPVTVEVAKKNVDIAKNEVHIVQQSEEEPFTEEERYLLCKIAMAEAEGESIDCKVAVMQVVLNRVCSSKFPDTIEGVIYDPNQFAPVWNGRFDRVEPDEDCIEAYYSILDGADMVGDAMYFEAMGYGDTWQSRNLEYVDRIDNTLFYR